MKMGEYGFIRCVIKSLFKGSGKITPKMEKKLKKLGFSIIRCKNHYILVYILDSGKVLQFTISKTPGDYRAGVKISCDILRALRKEIETDV